MLDAFLSYLYLTYILPAVNRAANLAWMAVEAKIMQFDSLVFTTDNILERQEERTVLYGVLDNAVKVLTDYYTVKHEKERKAVYGTPADREARWKDALKTEVWRVE